MPSEKLAPHSFESTPTPVAPTEKADAYTRLVEELKQGLWLQISERYLTRKKWSASSIARDAWQNFFDANGYSVDDISIEINKIEEESEIFIKGNTHYPFTRLLSLGSGYKKDEDRSAGGEGEGTRIMALHMLRDLGFSKVIFGSGTWQLEFYFDFPPTSENLDEEMLEKYGKTKELFVKLHEVENNESFDGNYLRCATSDDNAVKEFVIARDYFRHEENTDFMYPDIETPVGGFKYLHENDVLTKKSGNFYLNGMRVAVDREGEWGNLEGFNMWSNMTPSIKGKKIYIGRDRPMINSYQIEEVYIPFLLNSMTFEQLAKTIEILKPAYEKGKGNRIEKAMLKNAIAELKSRGSENFFKFSFDNYMVASENTMVTTTKECGLKSLGFIICESYLAEIGMERVETLIDEIYAMEEKKPDNNEAKRMKMLSELADNFIEFINSLKTPPSGFMALLEKTKPIKMFTYNHPFLGGKYDEGTVWMRDLALHTDNDIDIYKTISTYFHELLHKFGSDQSAEFSYALTDFVTYWTLFCTQEPEYLRCFLEDWKKVKLSEINYSSQEIGLLIENLLKRRESYEGIEFSEDEKTKCEIATYQVETLIKNIYGIFSEHALVDLRDNINNHPLILRLNELEAKINPDDELSILKNKTRLEKAIQKQKDEIKQMKIKFESLIRQNGINADFDEFFSEYGKINKPQTKKALRKKSKKEELRKFIRQHEHIYSQPLAEILSKKVNLENLISELNNCDLEQRQFVYELNRALREIIEIKKKIEVLEFNGQIVNIGILSDNMYYTIACLRNVSKEFLNGSISDVELRNICLKILEFMSKELSKPSQIKWFLKNIENELAYYYYTNGARLDEPQLQYANILLAYATKKKTDISA